MASPVVPFFQRIVLDPRLHPPAATPHQKNDRETSSNSHTMGKVIWFASHLLAISIHIGLVAASIYGFIECGSHSVSSRGHFDWSREPEACTDERGRILLPWVSFGVVSISIISVGCSSD